MTRIPFWKMHGAGNDFILVDDRESCFPAQNAVAVADLCRRRTGIGSEGLILLQGSEVADFRMQFFNPDGGEVDMCGNGARCVARLGFDIGAAPERMTIETRAGILHAVVCNESVCLELPPPLLVEHGLSLTLPTGEGLEYAFLNTGVPHVVIQTDTVEDYPVEEHGRAVRQHAAFSPDGANVNIVSIQDERHMAVRTYERGVEGETLACGTGITACAVVAVQQGLVRSPVTVCAASGDSLEVDVGIDGDAICRLSLTGPAVYVCTGEFEI
jgi:diaminopimelate epimerase